MYRQQMYMMKFMMENQLNQMRAMQQQMAVLTQAVNNIGAPLHLRVGEVNLPHPSKWIQRLHKCHQVDFNIALSAFLTALFCAIILFLFKTYKKSTIRSFLNIIYH